MKSLHTRLDPIKEDVLDVTKTFGRFKAMTRFRVASYDRFCNWLEEVTKDANFGINPKISPGSSQALGDQLVAGFLQKVAQLEAHNKTLRERIEFLEWQLDHQRDKEELQALAILEVCQA